MEKMKDHIKTKIDNKQYQTGQEFEKDWKTNLPVYVEDVQIDHNYQENQQEIEDSNEFKE